MGGTANVVPPAFCRKTYITYKNGVWGVAQRQVAGTPVPVFTPGTDAGRVCTRALHDAKPTKHTQPFTEKRGLEIGIINQKFISKTDFFYNLRRYGKCRAACSLSKHKNKELRLLHRSPLLWGNIYENRR